MAIRDTTLEALAVQLKIQRAMTGEQRMLLALDMSLFAANWLARAYGGSILSGPTPK